MKFYDFRSVCHSLKQIEHENGSVAFTHDFLSFLNRCGNENDTNNFWIKTFHISQFAVVFVVFKFWFYFLVFVEIVAAPTLLPAGTFIFALFSTTQFMMWNSMVWVCAFCIRMNHTCLSRWNPVKRVTTNSIALWKPSTTCLSYRVDFNACKVSHNPCVNINFIFIVYLLNS